MKRVRGVAIAVSGKLNPFVKEIKMINQRLMWIHLKILHIDYVIISAYGPTSEDYLKNNNEETEYPNFINTLDDLIKSVKTKYPSAVLIVGGDFNARVEKSVTNDENLLEELQDILGDKLSCERNNAGEHLIDLYVSNKLSIVNSFLVQRKWDRYLASSR